MEKEIKPKGKHIQKEAFCLMKYRCEKCHKEELIWNSRDGVTPFAIGCNFCKGIMQHVDWAGDKYLPDYFPKRGDRVFITMPDTILHLILKTRVEAYWLLDIDTPYSIRDRYSTKEEAFKALLQDSHLDEGQPYLLQL